MKLLGRTIKGTQKPNPKIRMMMDGMLGNFVYFSNPGMSWASERDVETFRAMGIDYVVIPADRFIDQDEPAWGIGTRHHTKFTIGDVDGRAIAFGGGRHYSSAHFDDKIPPKDGINIFEKMASIERGSFHEISYTVQGPVVRPIHETFMDDFESNGGKKIENRASMLASDLYRPASHPGDSSGARYVDHHSYQDQNCSNVVSLLLEDRKSDEVTFVNSFTPTEEVYEGLKLAARHGKKVRLVIGSLANIYDWIRDPRFEELLHVGVEIYLVPERLHTKLYGNSRHYAFGNHNLDDASLKDDEDLMVVRKESNAGKVQNKYVDSLIERATPLHVEWRKGVKLSEILDRAYEMKDPPEEKISKEEDTPFLEVANHLVLEGFDLGLDIVSGVTREVLGGRFVPPLRGTAVYLDGKLGGGLDLNFGNMGERYVASPKPDWRTFFISQYAFKLGLYYFDRDFLFTGGFASRSAPIELRLGDYTPQISWDNYTGLTLAESIDNHFGVRIQSGTYLHLQGETLGGRFGLHRANTFLKPAANFDPMSIDPLIMNPNTTYLTLDASASFENDRAKYSFGPYAAIKPNSNDLSYGLFGKLKWYKAYPRDEIMSFKASVQKDEDDLRGYLQFEIPFTGP
jgi:hypothetical protein